jgi:hypothetical protein
MRAHNYGDLSWSGRANRAARTFQVVVISLLVGGLMGGVGAYELANIFGDSAPAPLLRPNIRIGAPTAGEAARVPTVEQPAASQKNEAPEPSPTSDTANLPDVPSTDPNSMPSPEPAQTITSVQPEPAIAVTDSPVAAPSHVQRGSPPSPMHAKKAKLASRHLWQDQEFRYASHDRWSNDWQGNDWHGNDWRDNSRRW